MKETERRQRTCAEGSSSTRLRVLNAKPISFLQLITIMCVVNDQCAIHNLHSAILESDLDDAVNDVQL